MENAIAAAIRVTNRATCSGGKSDSKSSFSKSNTFLHLKANFVRRRASTAILGPGTGHAAAAEETIFYFVNCNNGTMEMKW